MSVYITLSPLGSAIKLVIRNDLTVIHEHYILIRERPFDFYGWGGAGRFFEKKIIRIVKRTNKIDRMTKQKISRTV